MPRYCVIGAGAAGLAALQTLLVADREVDCFEASDRVGGHWNTDYEALHLITSRDVTGYADFPMPGDYPLFPSRDHVTAYLNAYADAHGLRDHITFGVQVETVVPVPTHGSTGSAGWLVTTSDGRERAYEGVFVANGHLHDQRIPSVPGEFSGKQIHSGSYRSTADVEGTRVLVVGSGNSGCDLAVDAAQHRLETSICVRSGHIFQPKTFFGVPRSELTFLRGFTFEEQDLLTRLLIRVSKGTYDNYPGLPEPPFRTLAEGAPVVNDLLLYWIQHGRVTVVPGIERFDGRAVHFSDGTSREFDTVLWATGFHPSLPFLDDTLVQRADGVPLRTGGGIVPAGLDRLYLIGLAAPRGPQIALYPVQSALALAMAELWEHGLDSSLAAVLEAEQTFEQRIDMIRPVWESQLESTRDLVQRLAARQHTRLDPPAPRSPTSRSPRRAPATRPWARRRQRRATPERARGSAAGADHRAADGPVQQVEDVLAARPWVVVPGGEHTELGVPAAEGVGPSRRHRAVAHPFVQGLVQLVDRAPHVGVRRGPVRVLGATQQRPDQAGAGHRGRRADQVERLGDRREPGRPARTHAEPGALRPALLDEVGPRLLQRRAHPVQPALPRDARVVLRLDVRRRGRDRQRRAHLGQRGPERLGRPGTVCGRHSEEHAPARRVSTRP